MPTSKQPSFAPRPARGPTRTIPLQIGPFALTLETMASFDDILDQYARETPDDTDLIPYFADIWPSAHALAQALVQHPQWVQGQQVLELGSGLGLPAIVAHRLGAASVTATDFHPGALPFLRANAQRNQATSIQCALLDWRTPPTDCQYDCLLGSDLLYEPGQVASLAACARKLCAPGGTFLLADPLRKHLQDAVTQLEQQGFSCSFSVSGEIVILAARQQDSQAELGKPGKV